MTRISPDTTVPGSIRRLLLGFDQGSPDECWLWKKATWKGYANIKWFGQVRQAHRLVYLLNRGPITAGLQLDHLCRNRSCVNPNHLEPVTARENILRGWNPAALNLYKTHCPYGHPYSGSNLYVRRKGHRSCRQCTYESHKAGATAARMRAPVVVQQVGLSA